MSVRIVILEDDFYDWEWARDALKDEFPAAELDWISTEQEFVSKLDEFVKTPPTIFVLDVMVPWTKPHRGQTEDDIPDEIRKDGWYAAGLRCLDRLRQIPVLKKIPYVLYTGLDANNFSEFVVHTKSENMRPLIDEIGRQMGARGFPPR